MISIFWNARHEDSEKLFFTRDTEYLAGDWAECDANAESAVNDLVENWFSREDWSELIGGCDDTANIVVTVSAPPVLTGIYEVTVELVVKARARRVQPESGRLIS